MVPLFEGFATSLLIAQNDGNAGQVSPINNPIFLIVIVSLLFYFIVLRPDRKKRQETEQKLKQLKKNDRIITIGGIFGTVVQAQADSEEVTIKVDENANTKIRILRTAVRDVIRSDGENKSSTSDKESQKK